ncbi:MAG: hypothetical protein WC606_02235 [Candidatus Absconditabacterales bacterium]
MERLIGKKKIILKIKKENSNANKMKPRFDTMEELNEWVLDLPESERKKQETTKEISDALQYFVDQQNEKAIGYMKNFRTRIQEKFEHKIWKKYFGSQSKTDILKLIMKDDEIRKKRKSYEYEIETVDETLEKEFKKKVYEAIKRLFNKEITNHGGSDIDKEAGFKLLQLAKFFKNEKGENIEYTRKSVSHGERGEKGFEYDSGGTRNGLEVVIKKIFHLSGTHKGKSYNSLFNALAIADEHDKSDGAKNIAKPASSTHIIFDLLDELGVLHPKFKDQIQRFVDFVDKADSKHYQFAGADREVSHKTLFGLHRKVPIDNIYKYFETPGRTGFEVLSEEELKKLEIKNGHETQQKENERKENEANVLLAKGRFSRFNNEGFIFALGKELSGGQQISAGIGGYGIFQIFESGDLYMYSPTPLPPRICGFSTENHFLIIKKIKQEDLKKIIDIFEFGRDAEKGLKENFMKYREDQIKKEQEKIDQKQKSEDEKKANQATLFSTENNNYFELGKEYNGMINSIQNKVAYVTLNKEGTINGRIKVEDKQALKKYAVGDVVKVKIESNVVEDNKLKISLSLVPAKE